MDTEDGSAFVIEEGPGAPVSDAHIPPTPEALSKAQQLLGAIQRRINVLRKVSFLVDRAKLRTREIADRRKKNKLARAARRINRITRKPQTGNRSRGR